MVFATTGISFSEIQRTVEPYLQEYLREQKSSHAYGDLFEGLYDDVCEFISRKGKRIRPVITVYAYQALGGERALTNAGVLQASVAMELLHTFTLLHDDVIDQSEVRRDLPTFHKVIANRFSTQHQADRVGENVAVIMGDIVFAMAMKNLNGLPFSDEIKGRVLGRFIQYATDTGVGELYDILLGGERLDKISREEIYRMYHLKTTRYTFEAPTVIGAFLAGATEAEANEIAKFTEPMGRAFQIVNDLSEYEKSSGDGASFSSDLMEGKKTLLLHEAFQRLDEVNRLFLQMCLQPQSTRTSTISKIRDLIDQSGAVEALRDESDALLEESEGIIQNSGLSDETSYQFQSLVKMIREQF